MDRTTYVIRNIITKYGYTFVTAILGFLIRKLFIINLGSELLGAEGLLMSVVSGLSLLELGFGTAISYSLYKPIADGDKEVIKSILGLYRKAYLIIASIIFCVGLVIIPFLPIFIKTQYDMTFIYKMYMILLLDAVMSYYCVYRRNLYIADQKEYKITVVDSIFSILTSILQIAAICLYKNYIGYILARIIMTVIRNLIIHFYAGNEYPFIKEKAIIKLPLAYRNEIFKSVKALIFINLASYFVFGTDNILLSFYGNLYEVAIYTNYATIITILNKIFNNIFTSMTAGIGNYLVKENSTNIQKMFNKLFFINFILTSYSSIVLLVVVNNFITFWVGKELVWPLSIVGIVVINNYARYILSSTGAFISASGIYGKVKNYKFISTIEGLTNIVFSILLAGVFKMRIYGVFLGTTISTLVSTFGMPYYVYRYILKVNFIPYCKRYMQYFVFTVICFFVCFSISRTFNIQSLILDILIKGMISSAIFIIGIILFWRNTIEYKEFKIMVRGFINKRERTKGK